MSKVPKIPLVKSSIDYVSIFSNQQDIKTIFRRVKRSEDSFKKTLSQSHNKFYQKIMHHRRLQLQEEFGNSFDGMVDLAKPRNRHHHQDQIQKFKKFSNYIEEDIENGMSQQFKDQNNKKQRNQSEVYEKALSINNNDDFLNNNISPQRSILQRNQEQDQSFNNELVNRELEALFAQQNEVSNQRKRRITEINTDRKEIKILFDSNALDNISFIQFVKYMKDKDVLEQVLIRLQETIPELNQDGVKDLRQLLPEADKKLFMAYRDRQITMDQLKTRVNQKMQRATYKCLDDLIQDGLHPSILQNLDQAGKLIQMIHGKDSINDISIKELTSLDKPWQSNPHCLRSLFQSEQADERQALQKEQRRALANAVNHSEFHPQLLEQSVISQIDESFRGKLKEPQVIIRNRSEENLNRSKKNKKGQIFDQKLRQIQKKELYIKKLKKTLNDYSIKHQKEQQENAGDRNNQKESTKYASLGADINVLCIPFDLKKIDVAMQDQQIEESHQYNLKTNEQRYNKKGSVHRANQSVIIPLQESIINQSLANNNRLSIQAQSIDQRSVSAKGSSYGLSKKDKKKPINKEMLFLRQINQEGGKVYVNKRDQHILQEYVDDEDIFDSSVKRIEIRKPRPRDILKNGFPSQKIHMQFTNIQTAEKEIAKKPEMQADYQYVINEVLSESKFDNNELASQEEMIMSTRPANEIVRIEITTPLANQEYRDTFQVQKSEQIDLEKPQPFEQQQIQVPSVIQQSYQVLSGVLQNRKRTNVYGTHNQNSPNKLSSPTSLYQNQSFHYQNQGLKQTNPIQPSLNYEKEPIRNVYSQQISRRQSLSSKLPIQNVQSAVFTQKSLKTQEQSQNRFRNSTNNKTNSTNVSQNFLNYVENLGIHVDNSKQHLHSKEMIIKRNRIFSAKTRPNALPSSQDISFMRTPSQSSHISLGAKSMQRMDYKSGAIAYRIAMKQLQENSSLNIRTSAQLFENINTISNQLFSPVQQISQPNPPQK
ncbi:UNKNOWN [Stylonychia lemnae]|uniref:Uncharacterized protein n=1 Tax=Stylonychia lemnae TaxID=5949 RepID=A0A078AI85_STYLE|nr:UNKNOWN [Stylonychia lemnae]|eukprot:CDW81222.1 UNKNOWN [Stylonychia lemnae]